MKVLMGNRRHVRVFKMSQVGTEAHREARRESPLRRGSPWENEYIDSFNARLRDEFLDGEIFYTLRDARNSRPRNPGAVGRRAARNVPLWASQRE